MKKKFIRVIAVVLILLSLCLFLESYSRSQINRCRWMLPHEAPCLSSVDIFQRFWRIKSTYLGIACLGMGMLFYLSSRNEKI